MIQIGLESFSPVMLGFARFVLASAFVTAVLLMRHPLAEVAAVARRERKPLLAFALLYVTLPNIAQNLGLQHGTSSIASVIQSCGPVMTLLFAVLLLGEPMTKTKGFGTAIAISGTLMLLARGGFSLEDDDFSSGVMILLSATSYGLGWVSAKGMVERNPPLVVIGLSLLLGTAFLGVAVPFEPGARVHLDPISLANLFVLGILCAGASSILYLASLRHEEVSRMAFFIYLMPVFASLFAWTIRGEGVAPWTVVCGAIIVAGVAVANRERAR